MAESFLRELGPVVWPEGFSAESLANSITGSWRYESLSPEDIGQVNSVSVSNHVKDFVDYYEEFLSPARIVRKRYDRPEVVDGWMGVPEHVDEHLLFPNILILLDVGRTDKKYGTLSVSDKNTGERKDIRLNVGDALLFHPSKDCHSWDCHGYWMALAIPVDGFPP
jgi:hypothetical protein